MARYRRNFIAGGTFFFTVKLADPKSRLLVEHIDLLRATYMDVQKQYPFETVAVCVLPNHIHAIWTLPPDDADYSLRCQPVEAVVFEGFVTAVGIVGTDGVARCVIVVAGGMAQRIGNGFEIAVFGVTETGGFAGTVGKADELVEGVVV